jgi:hypothetical protein
VRGLTRPAARAARTAADVRGLLAAHFLDRAKHVLNLIRETVR